MGNVSRSGTMGFFGNFLAVRWKKKKKNKKKKMKKKKKKKKEEKKSEANSGHKIF